MRLLKFVRMGKVDFFVVEFYGGKRTYYPGEAINGTLRLKVNKELKLRGIRLEFHGKAYIHWSESSGSGKNRRTRHYSNSETYIDTLATLFGKGKLLLNIKLKVSCKLSCSVINERDRYLQTW